MRLGSGGAETRPIWHPFRVSKYRYDKLGTLYVILSTVCKLSYSSTFHLHYQIRPDLYECAYPIYKTQIRPISQLSQVHLADSFSSAFK